MQDHTYKTVSTSEKMMSPQCYQSPCPIHCLGILPDPSIMMTDSFSIGRTLATRFGALVFLYRQNNFLSTTGKSKMLSPTPEDAWAKRTTEGLRVPPLWVMTLEKSLKTWQAWTALTHSPALGPLPNTGSSTADWAQDGHNSKGPELSICLAHCAQSGRVFMDEKRCLLCFLHGHCLRREV